jgi:hypothetical protein
MGYRPRRPLGPLSLGSQSSAEVTPEQSSFTIASQLASQGAENAIGPDEQGVAVASPLNSPPGAMRGGGTASSSTIRFSQANSDPSVAPPVMTLNSRGGKAGGSYSPKQTLSSGSAGMPLAPSVRSPLARSFGADLSPMRVHTDRQAQETVRGLSTRAFTFTNHVFLGSGERPDDLGLMAHETAHALQQRGAPGTIQRFTSGKGDSCEVEAQQASAAVLRGESFSVQQTTAPRPQGLLGIDIDWPDPLDWLANKANIIPFFRLFTIVLGVNPINMSPVDRNAANLLRAMIEIMPGGGLITQALDNSGVFEKAGAFVEKQIDALGMTGSAIKSAVTAFIDGLSLRRLVTDPGGVWESAKAIFTGPIDQILAFGAGLVSGIVELVKDAILKPIAKMAEGTEGYNLLKGILGKDPITGEAVTPSAETLLGPLMKMIGLGDVWQKMQDAKAIPRAWAWFQSTMGQLVAIVSSIPSAFLGAFKSLTLEDIILVPKAFIKLGKVFLGFVGKFVSWGLDAMWKLLEIVFDVVSPGAWGYAQKTGAALKSILKNPLPFVGNLAKAAKLGFQNFGSNFLDHLKKGLIDWLTGSLTGIYIPKALTLPEFGKLAISVLGVSWAQIRGKIVKALGPNGELIMKGLEAVFDVVMALVNGGPAAAWEVIKDKLTSLKETIISGITSMVVEAVVTKAIPKFVAMFIPGAGFFTAIISIYDIVMVFVQKISAIIQVVNSFVSSIVAIAAGDIGGAASKVESILGGLLSLAINFLAGFAGLGKIASKVRGIVDKVRGTVDKALDAAIAFIIEKAKKLFAYIFGGRGKDDKPPAGPDTRSADQKRKDLHAATVEAGELLSNFTGSLSGAAGQLAAIQQRYKLKSLKVAKGAHGPKVVAEINPLEELPIAMPIGVAVKALKGGASEVAVRSLSDARAVLAQAFPEARESQGPTAMSAFPSAEQVELIRSFRAARGTDLQFHIDVERVNVAAIRSALSGELAKARQSLQFKEKDLDKANKRYHRDDPLGQAEINRLIKEGQTAREKVRRLEDFDRDWASSWEPRFKALEKESQAFQSGGGTRTSTGVLQGHETVKDNPKHRFIAHINVEGVRVADGTAVKAVIFIV